jgi:hypothetical protein
MGAAAKASSVYVLLDAANIAEMVGSVVSDSEGRDLYLDYARQDRCAMWVRIPDAEDVPQALRGLADHDYVHTRATRSRRVDRTTHGPLGARWIRLARTSSRVPAGGAEGRSVARCRPDGREASSRPA